MMDKYYTGVGSRNTPKEIQAWESRLATELEQRGYKVRTGGAQGSDKAFEWGVGNVFRKEVYVPWEGFNGYSEGPGVIVAPTLNNYHQAVEIAASIHPAWNRLTRGARALHIRNVYQVLGQDLNTPSQFLLCWAEYQGKTRTAVKGGTNTAVQLARQHHVPVINLFGAPSYDAIYEKVQPYLI